MQYPENNHLGSTLKIVKPNYYLVCVCHTHNRFACVGAVFLPHTVRYREG